VEKTSEILLVRKEVGKMKESGFKKKKKQGSSEGISRVEAAGRVVILRRGGSPENF